MQITTIDTTIGGNEINFNAIFSYTLDIDRDGSDDFMLYGHQGYWHGPTTAIARIECLNSNSYIIANTISETVFLNINHSTHDNGNKIDKYSVKWDSSLNKCFAGYTIRAIEGVSDTITVSGEAKGFFRTSIDTRVYFIKNY